MRNFAILLFVLLLSCSKELEVEKTAYEYVDPFIGTGGHGHTHPAATMPFGMIQAGPDTRLEGWDGCSGYHYTDSALYGFSHTHLSGTGIGDYNDVLFLPMIQSLSDELFKKEAIAFNKATEVAKAGYYACEMSNGVNVQISSDIRSAMHHYTFPNKDAVIKLDLAHRDKTTDTFLEIESEKAISGWRHSEAWAQDQRIFFYAEFSEPIVHHLIENNKETDIASERDSIQALFEFKLANKELKIKIGISAVSIEGARQNLKTEIKHWDFNQVHANAMASWNEALSKIEVIGKDEDDKTKFYTSLYHSMVVPNTYSDVDGNYRGMDREVHHSDHTRYTIFSLWDTFRAAHPLYTIIEQEKTNSFVNNFLDMYKEGGRIPIWELAGNYTDCMIGYHAIPVIADAYAKGLRDYDHEAIYQAMKHSAMRDEFGLEDYKVRGYVSSSFDSESVSKTLEYAYDDWCIAQMARWLGHEEDYAYFTQRAQSYKNIYDRETQFMRARNNGMWHDKVFDPYEVNFHFTEANSWQYSLFAPQDVSGLMDLLGGEEGLDKWLDAIFSANEETSGRHQSDITGLIGQYAHGNEPSHHMAYLYSYTGNTNKTQAMCRRIMDELYTTQPDGLSGNEDCGQMSAWYVMSAMGIYSVTPGTDYYVIGSPIFDQARVNLENGNSFEIIAENNSKENIYIQSATLNGSVYDLAYIHHEDIIAGGKLTFKMGSQPSQWGTKRDVRPKSFIRDHLIVPLPIIKAESRTFTDEMIIEIDHPLKMKTEFRTESSKGWESYSEPFKISGTTRVYARAKKGEQASDIVETGFVKIDGKRSIEIKTAPQSPYIAEGSKSLIDGLKGNNNFKTGYYHGYREDFEAVIDLGEIQDVSQVNLGCVQDIRPWIWFPKSIEVLGSVNGLDYKLLGTIQNTYSDKDETAMRKEFETKFSRDNFRYIKVKAEHFGQCPEWHLGAGGQAWLFIDEIEVF
ncbi:MAG: GH92 family glycosyl hydrolase [Bacteroidota bacterium]